MKKTMNKKLLFSAASILAVSCFSVGMIGLNASASTTYEVDTTKFDNVAGASIKLVENEQNSGIRFSFLLEKDYYTSLVKDDAFNQVEVGAALVRTAKLNKEDITAEDVLASTVTQFAPLPANTWFSYTTKTGDVYTDVNGKTWMSSYAYVYEIPSAYYGEEISAVGYIKNTATNDYMYVTDVETRSIAYVASGLLYDSEEMPNEEAATILQSYIAGYDLTPVVDITYTNLTVSDTEEVKDEQQLNVTTALPTTVSYVSSNEDVATVDANGKITAVGVGSATITVSALGSETTKSVAVNVQDYDATYNLIHYAADNNIKPRITSSYNGNDISMTTGAAGNNLFAMKDATFTENFFLEYTYTGKLTASGAAIGFNFAKETDGVYTALNTGKFIGVGVVADGTKIYPNTWNGSKGHWITADASHYTKKVVELYNNLYNTKFANVTVDFSMLVENKVLYFYADGALLYTSKLVEAGLWDTFNGSTVGVYMQNPKAGSTVTNVVYSTDVSKHFSKNSATLNNYTVINYTAATTAKIEAYDKDGVITVNEVLARDTNSLFLMKNVDAIVTENFTVEYTFDGRVTNPRRAISFNFAKKVEGVYTPVDTTKTAGLGVSAFQDNGPATKEKVYSEYNASRWAGNGSTGFTKGSPDSLATAFLSTGDTHTFKLVVVNKVAEVWVDSNKLYSVDLVEAGVWDTIVGSYVGAYVQNIVGGSTISNFTYTDNSVA